MKIVFKKNNYTILGGISGTLTVDTTKVPDDRERGYLIFNRKSWDFLEPSTYKLLKERNNKVQTIVLVLESPHKDEFDSNHKPIRPANGVTGANIEYFIKRRYASLWNLSKDVDYKICLVNAVQFQASCHYALTKAQITLTTDYQKKALKFYVLYLAFQNNNLIKRLSNCSPDIIVNCCTTWSKKTPKVIKENIYELVQSAIEEYKNDPQYPNCITIKCTHPSFWK